MSKFEKESLENIIKESFSIREALQKLNIIPAGGNYQTIKKYIKKFSIDTSHFKGQGWSKNKKLPHKRPVEDYLSNKFPIQSYKLKNRLFKEGIFDKHICNKCKNTEWLGKAIPLELEHIDGNNQNNNLSNLELLCPNCHSFTLTYRGKKLRKSKIPS